MLKSSSLLSVVAALAAACATSPADHDGAGGAGGAGGKADGAGDAAGFVSCNGGAMVIGPDAARPGQFVATVFDQGVIEWFVAQSETTYTAQVEYSGASQTVTVQRRFPWMVSVTGEPGARRMDISDLRRHGNPDRYSSSGPGGVTIASQGDGLRLAIHGSHMPMSHSILYYLVGQWGFESCIEEPPWTCNELEGDLFMPCRDEGISDAECIEGPSQDLWLHSVAACCAAEPGRSFCGL